MAQANRSVWTEETLQKVVAIAWIFAHFITLVFVFLLGIVPNPPPLDWKEVTATLCVVAPLFAANTTVMVRSIVGESDPARGRAAPVLLTFVSLFFPATFFMFVLLILAALICKVVGFQEFLEFLGGLETLFGLYLGAIVKRLFSHAPEGCGNGTL
jgi:hypothetical protein